MQTWSTETRVGWSSTSRDITRKLRRRDNRIKLCGTVLTVSCCSVECSAFPPVTWSNDKLKSLYFEAPFCTNPIIEIQPCQLENVIFTAVGLKSGKAGEKKLAVDIHLSKRTSKLRKYMQINDIWYMYRINRKSWLASMCKESSFLFILFMV